MEKPRLIQDLGRKQSPSGSSHKYRYGLYECPYCNTEFIAPVQSVNHGNTNSCGCLHKEFLKTKITHGDTGTRLHRIWRNMRQRCYNPNNPKYHLYGGRGIFIDLVWYYCYSVFKEWSLNNGYKSNLEIDRIDNNGHYCAGNCRWTTRSVNCQNEGKKKRNTTGYIGVFRGKPGKWRSVVQHEKRYYRLGTYDNILEAIIVRNNWIIEHGTFHPLNPIPPSLDNPIPIP